MRPRTITHFFPHRREIHQPSGDPRPDRGKSGELLFGCVRSRRRNCFPVRSPSNAARHLAGLFSAENYPTVSFRPVGASQFVAERPARICHLLTESVLGETLSNPKWAPRRERAFHSQSRRTPPVFSIDIRFASGSRRCFFNAKHSASPANSPEAKALRHRFGSFRFIAAGPL